MPDQSLSFFVLKRPSILAFFDHFYPSVKSGGPAKSALGFAELLADAYDLTIVTRNHDFGDSIPYPSVVANTRTTFPSFGVYYLNRQGFSLIAHLIHQKPDFIYLNSFFSSDFTIKPLLKLKGTRGASKIVLAPRGELAPSALQKSFWKKKVYRTIFPLLEGNITYQASSGQEAKNILDFLPGRRVVVAPNLRPPSDLSQMPVILPKEKGRIRVCLIARIHPIKNIHQAIAWVLKVNSNQLEFDIYGFPEDAIYLEKCRKLAADSGGTIRLLPGLSTSEVVETLARYHLFFLPTLGENFGHSILEAFIASRPVLISDQTPWKGLLKSQAGLDAPLKEKEMREGLAFFLNMGNEEYQQWCTQARAKAVSFFEAQQNLKPYFDLFKF